MVCHIFVSQCSFFLIDFQNRIIHGLGLLIAFKLEGRVAAAVRDIREVIFERVVLVFGAGIIGFHQSAVHVVFSVPVAHDRNEFSHRSIRKLHGRPVDSRFFKDRVFSGFLDVDLPGGSAVVRQIKAVLLGIINKLLCSLALPIGLVVVDDAILEKYDFNNWLEYFYYKMK